MQGWISLREDCGITVKKFPLDHALDHIRITHPTSQSYSGKSLAEIYQQHEKEKKDKYNQTVIDIEKNPLSSSQLEGWHQNATE